MKACELAELLEKYGDMEVMVSVEFDDVIIDGISDVQVLTTFNSGKYKVQIIGYTEDT